MTEPYDKLNAMRVMIVEDDPPICNNLSLLLGGEPGLDVCGVYYTGEEALVAMERDRPDILITDIGLPGMSGIDLIRKAKRQFTLLDIIAYTVFDDRETVFGAIKAGASGYILKGSTPRQVIDAIQNLAEGGAPMSPKIARAVINEFHEPDPLAASLLTLRETEILKLLARGYSYKIIADRCTISPHTVNSHIKKIYDKLHAQNRSCALFNARRHGIL